jgi:hypothetical protein
VRELVLVHGRAQEHKNASSLKAEWIEALEYGLSKNGLKLPIDENHVRFPFYGDTLYGMTEGKLSEAMAEIIVRGDGADQAEQQFTRAILRQMRDSNVITDAQLEEIAGPDAIERGPLNWEWFQDILRAVDRFVPYGSGTSIALFTRDVYKYLKDSLIRETIDTGVRSAMTPAMETVVVAHSLGTVVAYNLLRQQGSLLGWKVPLFVTVGSPLAIEEVRNTLKSFSSIKCPDCVSHWFNAMDTHDVVALYPLNEKCFPLANPLRAIENKTNVRNRTTNRHGIAGYLDDADVAKRIHDALIA